MRFIQDTAFRIKPNKAEGFQQWLIANEDRLAKSYPEGTSLFGMFVTLFGDHQGEIHILEILDSYGAMDRMAAEAKNPDSEYRRASDGMDQFLDLSHGMPVTMLFKDVVDATVINPQVSEEEEPAGV